MYSLTFNERPASNALDKLLETISPFPNYCIVYTPNFPIPHLPNCYKQIVSL